MVGVEGESVPFAALVLPLAARQAGVRGCHAFLPLLPRVRLAVPEPGNRGARRCSRFLPLPPSYRDCRPFLDVLPGVMSPSGDCV